MVGDNQVQSGAGGSVVPRAWGWKRYRWTEWAVWALLVQNVSIHSFMTSSADDGGRCWCKAGEASLFKNLCF